MTTTIVYRVVSDRYASEPVLTTFDKFMLDCKELGWQTPNLVWSGDDWIDAETGGVILEKA
jgi:hypothetical protein